MKIVDQCPPCSTGHLDLSKPAFARIADPRKGVTGVTYRLARDPRPSGKLAFRVKEGSSQWWLGLLVINHGNPLTSVEIRQSGRWRKLLRTDYNYWLAEKPGPGPGPFTVRIIDARGYRATVRKIRLAPEKVQRTNVRMY